MIKEEAICTKVVKELYDKIFQKELKEKRQKWSFDFVNEIPINFGYEWAKKGGKWVGRRKLTVPDVNTQENVDINVNYECSGNFEAFKPCKVKVFNEVNPFKGKIAVNKIDINKLNFGIEGEVKEN